MFPAFLNVIVTYSLGPVTPAARILALLAGQGL
jgi:hypothetical protein